MKRSKLDQITVKYDEIEEVYRYYDGDKEIFNLTYNEMFYVLYGKIMNKMSKERISISKLLPLNKQTGLLFSEAREWKI